MKTSFKQFLAEFDEQGMNVAVMTDVLRTINADCKQFLHRTATAGKFNPFYIGLNAAKWPDVEVKTRSNPFSFSKNKAINDSLIREFEELYGSTYTRNTLVATGNPLEAAKNGVVHIIFPIGKYDYVWSEKLPTLFSDLDLDEHSFGEEFAEAKNEVDRDKITKKYLKDAGLSHNEGINRCSNHGDEIIISCSYYYAVPLDMFKKHKDQVENTLGVFNISKKFK
jgi:hypothetical protein